MSMPMDIKTGRAHCELAIRLPPFHVTIALLQIERRLGLGGVM